MKVLQEDPTHSGALFELGSYEHTHGNYHSAISLLKKAIDGNQETVNEKTRDEYLGAPSIADAKSALATVMSLESYCPDHMFDTYRMEEGTGVYDTDVPIEIDSDVSASELPSAAISRTAKSAASWHLFAAADKDGAAS